MELTDKVLAQMYIAFRNALEDVEHKIAANEERGVYDDELGAKAQALDHITFYLEALINL